MEKLIPRRLAPEARKRIARAAGGNPLFIAELLAMTGEAVGDVVVPPTLHALLAARLDQLNAAERDALERAAVEGEVFHRGAVQALSPVATPVTPRLAALVRRGLIRPDAPQLPGQDGFRFRHLLIRDVAYDAIPKATRAELHERYARWLEEHATGIVELDEILGYHLERSCLYRKEVGLRANPDLEAAAGQRLSEAGRRALMRQDFGAASNLLERAVALIRDDDVDIALEVDLAEARFFAGRLKAACRSLSTVADRAAAAGDRRSELLARIEESYLRIDVAPEGTADELEILTASALPMLKETGDDFGLYLAYSARAMVAHQRGQADEELAAWERSLRHARRTGLPHYERRTIPWLSSSRFRGTTPVHDLLSWLDEDKESEMLDPYIRTYRALGLGMLGRFVEGRAVLADVRDALAERGATLLFAVVTAQNAVELELLAGDPAAAAQLGQEGCRLLEEAGERSYLSTAAGYLGQSLYALGRFDTAEEWSSRAAGLGASDDVFTQTLSRQVRGKVLARRGEHGQAERLLREAVGLAGGTELLNLQGDAWSDLAEVLSLAGKADEAAAALEQALERYARKQNLVMAQRTRARLADLHTASTR